MDTGTRILLAEDDRDISGLIAFKLSAAGYQVQVVGDGAAALEAIRADPPALVLLDVLMPSMTGYEVLRHLRAQPALAQLPVILVSARSRDSDVDAGFASGADDYLVKPFSPRELLARVQRFLGRPR